MILPHELLVAPDMVTVSVGKLSLNTEPQHDDETKPAFGNTFTRSNLRPPVL